MHKGDASGRDRVILESVSGPQAVRGVAPGNRSLSAKPIPIAFNIPDRQLGKGQASASARDVGNVARSFRRLSSHSARKHDTMGVSFQVNEKRYMYLVLPFGLTTAPWAFTEVVKQVKLWATTQHMTL